jgi:hypothetical protein
MGIGAAAVTPAPIHTSRQAMRTDGISLKIIANSKVLMNTDTSMLRH